MVTASARLLGVTELMDLPQVDSRVLPRTLEDLARINRWLGGAQLVRRQLASLLPSVPDRIRILDVATGYGDIPRALVRWARQRRLPLEVEAVDRHDQILALAQHASRDYPEITLRHGNVLSLPYLDQSFDVVIASLILHHMEGHEPERLLRELYRLARLGVVVNELRRGDWPTVVAWVGLRILSRSHIIHHDGPLSFRRGFLPEELLALAREAGWVRPRVSRHPLFRLALIAKKR